MTTNLPLSSLSESAPEADRSSSAEPLSAKLERCRERHADSDPPALWTGTREGVISTVIVVIASLVFGGAAGVWFDQGDWFARSLVICGGTMVMGGLVSLAGSLLTGRDAVFWGIGMPLLVFFAGSACALISGYEGAHSLLFGAPAFCGLAILAGVMTSYLLDRGQE